MGNCAGKCDVCVATHLRLQYTNQECVDKLALEGYSDCQETTLLNQKENIDSAGSPVSQGLKTPNGHSQSPCFPIAMGLKPNTLQIDPMLIGLLSQKVTRSPLASANGNLLSWNNVDASQGEVNVMKKPAAELQLYVVTWNMNGRLQGPLKNISNLLDVHGDKYDFYVIGLQEAPNFSGDSVIAKVLGDNYCCVGSSLMMSLQLYIFAKKSLRPYITGSMIDKVGVGGFGQVVGRQKGAAAILLRYNKVSLLFITSHLAPHECNVAERNHQYERICQTVFTRQTGFCSGCKDLHSTAVEEPPQCKVRMVTNFVEDSDVVIWLGDLNYRVEMPRSSVGFLISHNLEEALWAKDQLHRAVKRGEVFKGFQEGPLLFPPTYKFDIGTDTYDTSAKERVPSWTDRILYKVKQSSPVMAELQEYTSISSVKTSDHRPVKALITLKNLLRTTSCNF